MKHNITKITLVLCLLSSAFMLRAQSDSTETDSSNEVDISIDEAIETDETPAELVDDIEVIMETVEEAVEEALEEVEEALEEVEEALEEAEQEREEALEEVEKRRIEIDNDAIHVEDEEHRVIINEKMIKVVVKSKDSLDNDIEEEIIIEDFQGHGHGHDHGDEDDGEYRHKIVTTESFGMQFGLNNVLNANGDLEMPQDYADMELRVARSYNFHLHFVQQALNIYRENVRIVYGIGMDWNNYRFKNDILLSNGGTDNSLLVSQSNVEYKKNKLTTNHLTVPLMLNLQFGEGSEKFSISAGANFGYLIDSYQRLKWRDNGSHKNRAREEFNLNPYRMGYEVQFGYGKLRLFGRYFPEPMFKDGMGPELRTVSAGILIGHI